MLLLKNSTIYFSASAVNALIPFFLIPVLTRYLEPVEYGNIVMFMLAVSIFSSFTGLSVHGAITVRYYELGKKGMSEFVSACLLLLTTSATLMVVIVNFLGEYLQSYLDIPLVWLNVAVLVAALQFIINILLSLFQVSRKPFAYGTLQISRTLVEALLSLLFIVGLSYSWEGRAYAQLYTVAGFGFVVIYLLHKMGYIGPLSHHKEHVKYALRFGIPLVPTAVGRMLLVVTDRLIITNLLSKEAAAIYTIALQFALVINIVAESFNSAYVPWLYERLKLNSKSVYIKKITYGYFVAIITFAVLYGLVAKELMPYILGVAYVESAGMVLFLSIGYALSGCYLMVVNYITYANKNEYLIYVVFFSGLLNIPLLYFMILKFGLYGAAYSFVIANILVFILGWYFSAKAYRMNWLDLKH